MKKLLYLLIIFIVLLMSFIFIPLSATAQENKITLHFFWMIGCPHCAKEEIFLKSLSEKYPNLEIKDYEISQNEQNRDLLIEVGNKLKADTSGVPFTVVGDKYPIGFGSEETTGAEIEENI